jgi:WD40 repeat protein
MVRARTKLGIGVLLLVLTGPLIGVSLLGLGQPRSLLEPRAEAAPIPGQGQDHVIDHPKARALAGTPDGKLWLTARKDIRIWDAVTGRLLRTIVPDEVPAKVELLALRVTGDGKTVWALTPTTIEGYTITSGKLLFRVKADVPSLCSFDVSSDGKFVVAGSYHNEMIFWDTATEKIVQKIKGDRTRLTAMEAAGQALPNLEQPVGTVTLSPDGKWLAAVALFDWTVRVYDVKTGAQKHAFLSNNPSYCVPALFSPDSTLLAMSRFNGLGDHTGKEVISIWDLQTGRLQQEYEGGAFGGFGMSPDWKWLAAIKDGVLDVEKTGKIHVWERATGKPRCVITDNKQNFCYSRFVFSPDGNTLAGCNHLNIDVWDLATGKKLPRGHRDR